MKTKGAKIAGKDLKEGNMLQNQLKLALSLTTMTFFVSLLGLSTSAYAGGDGSGGGNAVGNRLIEDYKVDVTTLAGYHEVVGPVLEQMTNTTTCIEKTVEDAMKKTAWYLIPEDIKEQSQALTGLPFSSDQIAVGVNGEVFIAQKGFDNLGTFKGVREQGKLLLHEIILQEVLRTSSFTKMLIDSYTVKGLITDDDKMNNANYRSINTAIESQKMTIVRKATEFLFNSPGLSYEKMYAGLSNSDWPKVFNFGYSVNSIGLYAYFGIETPSKSSCGKN